MQDHVFIIFSLIILVLGYFVRMIIVINGKLDVQRSYLQLRIHKFERERKVFKLNTMFERHENERSHLACNFQHGIVNLLPGTKLTINKDREKLLTPLNIQYTLINYSTYWIIQLRILIK